MTRSYVERWDRVRAASRERACGSGRTRGSIRTCGVRGGEASRAGEPSGDEGFTLVEVLVAFVVLALGIAVALEGLGLVGARTSRIDGIERASDVLALAIVGAVMPNDGLGGEGTAAAASGTDAMVDVVEASGGDGMRTVRASVRVGARSVAIMTVMPEAVE